MMKKLLLLFVMVSAVVLAEEDTEEKSFGYFAMGANNSYYLVPGVSLGGGYRTQFKNIGFDWSMDITSVINATHVEGSATKLFYCKSTKSSKTYCGIGVRVGLEHVLHKNGVIPFIAPQGAFGGQWQNENYKNRFIELNISIPFIYYRSNHSFNWDKVLIPRFVVRYGIQF
jgi:hypothetical protein